MRYKIRKLAIVLLLPVLLCGCQTDSGIEMKTAKAVPQEEIPTLIWQTVEIPPVDYEAGMENINTYLVEKLGIRLDIQMVGWSEWLDTSARIVNQGEYFDIMFVDQSNFNQFASIGAFQDITDMLYSYTPDLWQVMPELIWSGAKQGGRIYAVPTYKDSSLSQYWVFDDRYVQKYGINISAIHTWEDLDSFFRIVKEGEGESFYPLLLSRGRPMKGAFCEYDGFSSGLAVVGVKADDPERKVVSVLEEEEVFQRLMLLHQWYQDGIINPDANVVKENVGAPFFSGIGWPGAEVIWQEQEGVDKYVMQRIYGPVYTRDSIQGSMNAISSQSNYKKEALQLLELINTDRKLRDMLAYGVEGRNFEYVSEKVVRKLNGDWSMGAYTQGTFFVMSNQENAPADEWEQLMAINESADRSVLLGFEMNINEVVTELAACKNIWNEYAADLMTGAADPKTAVPECLEKMRANGLDTIISEAQKQIDEHFD